jgi:hypothetical protein
MYWLLGSQNSPQATNVSYINQYSNQWTYGKQLWGTASTSNIEILKTFPIESFAPTVKVEIRRYSSQYSARLSAHTNGLVVNHMELPENRRLRKHLQNDLPP